MDSQSSFVSSSSVGRSISRGGLRFAGSTLSTCQRQVENNNDDDDYFYITRARALSESVCVCVRARGFETHMIVWRE